MYFFFSFFFPSFFLSFFLFFFSFLFPSLPHRYSEVCQYNFNNPGWSYDTGHFTQVVWEKSVKLGIGKAVSGRCTYVVGRYSSRGNIIGDFKNNVKKGEFDSSSCRG